MTIALLTLVALTAAAAATLTIASLRRSDDLRGLAGMSLMMVAAICAVVYATLDDS